MKVGAEPGNYGKGNLGLGFLGPVADPEARKKKLSAELANGRLAMMAIIGMLLSRRYSFELVKWYDMMWYDVTIVDMHWIYSFLSSCFARFLNSSHESTSTPKITVHCWWPGDNEVLPGWLDWIRLGWLGQLHGLSSAQRCEEPWLQHFARVGEAKERLQPELQCFDFFILGVKRLDIHNDLALSRLLLSVVSQTCKRTMHTNASSK